MARNISISYGLLSFAGKLDGAREKPPETRNLCKGQPGKNGHDPMLLVQPSQCPDCGPIADFSVIVKGVKQGNTYAIITQDQVKDAKVETSSASKGKASFVTHRAADFMAKTAAGAALYYVTPAPGNEDLYQLLTALVAAHPELAFTSLYTPVSKEALYVLSVREGVLCMEERTREQNLKPAPATGGDVNQPMFDLLEATLDKMTMPYDPDTYADTYAVKLAQLAIEAQDQVAFGSKGKTETPAVTSDMADLAEKLKALAES